MPIRISADFSSNIDSFSGVSAEIPPASPPYPCRVIVNLPFFLLWRRKKMESKTLGRSCKPRAECLRSGLFRFASALFCCVLIAGASAPGPDVGAQAPPPDTVVTVTLHPRGFDPSRIELSGGRFLLAVHDRSGLEAIDLTVERADGAVLAWVRIPREIAQWHTLTDLPAGSYRIRATGNPESSCEIEILP